jgi:hypothetical protein
MPTWGQVIVTKTMTMTLTLTLCIKEVCLFFSP